MQQQHQALTLGADPELFIKQGNDFLSAHSYLEGSKHQPVPVAKGAIQVDGCAAEFNIDPCSSVKDWLYNLGVVQEAIQLRLDKFNLGLTLVPQPTVKFSDEYFDTIPPENKILGCEYDWCAYAEERKAPTYEQEDAPVRTSGGHVHFGFDLNDDRKANPESPKSITSDFSLTKQLDCSLYLGSLLFDHDEERRLVYGQVGSFRPKSYGMEYRVLSSAWLRSENLKRWVFETATWAFNDWVAGRMYYEEIDINKFSSKNPEEIKEALASLGIEEPKE